MDSYTIKFSCTINSKKLETIIPLLKSQIIKLDQDIDDSLITCCKYGNIEYVELYSLLYTNDFINKIATCIETATIYGHLNILVWMYDNYKAYVLNNNKLFNLSCSENKIDILTWYYKKDPTIVARSTSGMYNCCKNGNIEVAKWIHLIDPDHIKKNYLQPDIIATPLYKACEHGHLKFAKWLYSIYPEAVKQQCSSSSAPYRSIYYGLETIMYACCKYGYIDLAKWIYEVDPDQLLIHCGTNRRNPMGVACYYGHIDIMEWIWSINKSTLCDFYLESPFYEACSIKNIIVAKWIYEHDPKQLIYDVPYNPILISCNVEFIDVFELFVDYNRDYTRTIINECKEFFSYKKIMEICRFQTHCPKCRTEIAKTIKVYEEIVMECAVCLNKITEPRALSCGHIFCNECI